MQRYVVTTAPKAWRDWIITIIISERENKACCLAWHYRAIILTPVKLRTSVIKVHACVLEHWLCQCRELDVQRRKGATSSHAHAHAHAKRDNPVVPFFFSAFIFLWIFPYHLSDRLWDTEKPCWKPHHWGLVQTETHTPHICPPQM